MSLTLGGCGFATGGVVAAASSSGGGSADTPGVSTGFTVLQPKLSPAQIEIEITDAEANIAEVEFSYVLPGGVEQAMTRLPENPVRLAAARTGVRHQLTWDFAAEPGIGTAQLTKNVTLRARIRNGIEKTVTQDLGNDAPAIAPSVTADPVSGDVFGIVPLSFVVSDSSADIVAVQIEFQIEGAPPDAWTRIRPGATSSAPDPTLPSVEATVAGTNRVVFWDSRADLPALERPVRLRFTVNDAVATAAPVIVPPPGTPPLVVDNNERPRVQINDGALTAGGDRRRTVALPFTVFDDESDDVDVVFQWRPASAAEFEDLGTSDPGVLAALVQDEYFRRDKRICRPARLAAHGEGTLVDGTHVRTSDLAGGQGWVLPHGIVGRRISFLRQPAATPTIASAAWSTNPLSRPVAILPLDDGVEALVLDDAQGSARLVRVDVATGANPVTVATLAGTPTAMAWNKRRDGVLVATGTAGWSLSEVTLASGAATMRASSASASIRGLVAFADRVALATAGDELLRIEWLDAAPRTAVLLDNLSEPFGVVLDPLDRERVFLAERTFPVTGGATVGRIAAWDLRTRLPVAILPVASAPARPSALALDPAGRRLFVLSEPLTGGRVLRRYELGATGGTGVFASVASSSAASAVGTSTQAGWVVVDPAARSLLVQGGAIAARTVTGYDIASGVLSLDAPVADVGTPVRWRIEVASARDVAATPAGRNETFLWDTRDVAGAGLVVVRAVAIDSEFGPFTAASSPVAMDLDDFTSVPVTTSAIDLVADLNGDGALDVKAGAEVQAQTAPRVFAPAPNVAATATVSFDVNGDGRNDLVEVGSQVRIWHQTTTGTFAASPNTTIAIAADRLIDMDGDGRFDLVDDFVGVRFQTGSLSFGPAQAIVGGLFADMDDDGLVDVVERPPTASQLRVYLQGSSRTFPPSVSYTMTTLGPAGAPGFAVTLPTQVLDVDGDGRTDLVCGVAPDLFEPLLTEVLCQEAGSTFTRVLAFDASGDSFVGFGTDLDLDGMADFVGIAGLGVSTVLRQVAPRSFASGQAALISIPRFDIEGDGTRDTIAGSSLGFARGSANFASSRATGTPGGVCALGDFDGDGLIDLASARQAVIPGSAAASVAQAFAQQFGGAYATQAGCHIPLGGGDSGVAGVALALAGDLDGDGVSDFGFQSLAPLQFYHLATGSIAAGQFGPALLSDASDGFAFHFADVFGDVKPETLVVNSGSVQVGAQTIGPFPGGTSVRFVHCLSAGDLNGDQRSDVLVGLDATGAQVQFALQNPDGTLPNPGTALTTGASGDATVARIADLDGDGINDIAVLVGGTLRVRYGTGGGSFASAATVLSGMSDFELVDVDGDRDLDVLASSGQLLVGRQVAPRTFVTAFATDTVNGALEVADVDNDGVPDVAVRDPNGSIRVIYGGR